MWWKIILLVIVGLAVIIIVAHVYGSIRWQTGTKELHTKMQAVRLHTGIKTYDPLELKDLPDLVQRYFRTVLKEDQPLVSAVSVEHTGSFNMSLTSEQWKPFTSNQRVITMRPCFVWDARIRMAPGMTVFVHDAYVAGEGFLIAKLLGLFTVMEQPGTPELAHGELMRFFAEATWYPTALLPTQGVHWEAIDDTSARALANKPDLILADEPTGNLDTKSGGEIVKIFHELWKQGKTIVIITHDTNIARQAQRIIKLKDGSIEGNGNLL